MNENQQHRCFECPLIYCICSVITVIDLSLGLFPCSSDMSGASNTLAREFLTDVHQLCSAVAQRAEAREEDEEESHMVALGEYLVRGRGFLLLSTLDSIIDQVKEQL